MLEFLRGVSTILIFVSFILLCVNVYRSGRKSFYEQAALLPFNEVEEHGPSEANLSTNTINRRGVNKS